MAQKKTINAKKFMEDLRSGKSNQELMLLHSLDQEGLAKVFNLLVGKGLVTKDEIFHRKPIKPAPPVDDPSEDYREDLSRRLAEDHPDADQERCPQCGAGVRKTALTCPECGHLLSGQDRWDGTEPPKRFLDRIPPLVLGSIIAGICGIFLFYIFRDIIMPMSYSAGEKRAEDLRREMPKDKAPIQAARDLARVGAQGALRGELSRLMAEDIVSSSNTHYTQFTGGSRWTELSNQERMETLHSLRKAMESAGMPVRFTFNMPSGELYATVTAYAIRVEEPFKDASPSAAGSTPPAPDPFRIDIPSAPAPPAVNPNPHMPGGLLPHHTPTPGDVGD